MKKRKLPVLKKKIAEKIEKLPRKKHHPLVHHIRKKHNISHKTFYWMKEFSPKSHIATVIIKESLKILILASILSSLGGIALHGAQDKIITILPLLILLPALNDMIGDFGTIISSKFTTMCYTGKIKENPFKSAYIKDLFITVMTVALLASLYVGILAYFIAYTKGFAFTLSLFFRVVGIAVLSTFIIVSFIFVISVILGIRICRKGEDPSNFLIPLSTSIADLCNLAFLSAMAMLLF